jgi:hypothetical protein
MKSTYFACFLICALTGTAWGVVVDFEKYPGLDGKLGTPDDVPITAPSFFDIQFEQQTTQFASLGIEFLPNPPQQNQNEILNDTTFTRTVGSSRNLLSTLRGQYAFGPIEARFSGPVYELKMAIGLGDELSVRPNLLEIFDGSSNLISSVVGSDEFVTLTSAVPIARFRVTATSIENQAAIDDVEFTIVPEPAASALLIAAAAAAILRRRR